MTTSTSLTAVEVIGNTPIYKGTTIPNSMVYVAPAGIGVQYGLGFSLANGGFEVTGRPLAPGAYKIQGTRLVNGAVTDWSNTLTFVIK